MKYISAAVVLTLSTGLAVAQSPGLQLRQSTADSLSPEVRAPYEEAVAAYDRADMMTAVEKMCEVARLRPDSIEIQWNLIRVAEDNVRLDNFGLERGLEVADSVITAHENILASPRLPDWGREIIQDDLSDLQTLVDNAGEIVRARREAGDQFMRQYAMLEARAQAARQEWIARAREEYAANQSNGTSGVNTRDAVDANPMLLPSDHYSRGTSLAPVDANSALPERSR